MLEVMFDEINTQLEAQNLKIQKGKIVIVDATLVQSAARPLKKPNEEEMQEVSTEKGAEQKKRKLSHDPDATFLKKGDSCTLGYKGYLATDGEGLVKKLLFDRQTNQSR